MTGGTRRDGHELPEEGPLRTANFARAAARCALLGRRAWLRAQTGAPIARIEQLRRGGAEEVAREKHEARANAFSGRRQGVARGPNGGQTQVFRDNSYRVLDVTFDGLSESHRRPARGPGTDP